MPIQVSYMGTKRQIAPQVAAIIAKGPPGPLLDAFAGVCAIGSAVAPARQVWCNDIQLFASTVAQAFFTCPENPVHFDTAAELAATHHTANRCALEARFSHLLARERSVLDRPDHRALGSLEGEISEMLSGAAFVKERRTLSKTSSDFPYRLFAVTFAAGYLGLAQSIQVDSIRYAIDQLRHSGQLSDHQHRWLCLALCQAVSKVSTTTGHFAQYMTVKASTLRRFVAQRRRSVWLEWLRAIQEFAPIGTRSWRSHNRVFMREAVRLLEHLRDQRQRPAIVYADPPYTCDHYSRYYHLYETLLKYDYPDANGSGRYRSDRFVSPFSVKTTVETAMDELIAASARLDVRLVLSYPEKGLLPDAAERITAMTRRHYGRLGSITRLAHKHSSLGASKGHQKYAVKELIFVAG